MSEHRTHDVVLFGATGFTGRLTARYLASQYGAGEVRWAIAGRSADKLARIKEELVALDATCADVGVIVADVSDHESLLDMAASARVVATTAGPFIRYGEPVVRACVEAGTDYVDITGEPEYVDLVIEKYHRLAEDAGLRIVSCCGFDSIPHDLGVFYTVKQLPHDVPIRIEGFVRSRGTFSGGTWTSAVEAMGRMREAQKSAASRRAPRPDTGRRIGGTKGGIRYERELGKWVAPLPTIDPQVVKRSARALPSYGPDFRYGHYAAFKRLPMLAGTLVGIGSVALLAQAKPTRDLLYKVRTPGQGPSEAQIEKGWFEVVFLAEADGKKLRTRVSGGDPGYGETAKMIAESALCLALDRDLIPDRAGVLTTAVAMGEPLIDRLSAAGMRFETL